MLNDGVVEYASSERVSGLNNAKWLLREAACLEVSPAWSCPRCMKKKTEAAALASATWAKRSLNSGFCIESRFSDHDWTLRPGERISKEKSVDARGQFSCSRAPFEWNLP